MKTIIMIDDEPQYITAHADALRLHGYEVTTISDVDEALQLLQKTHYDLIILDLLMPLPRGERSKANADLRKTGLRLHRHIRQKLQLDSPIIVVSAVRDDSLIERISARELKVRSKGLKFHKKPLRIRTLLDSVESLIGHG